MPSLKSVLRLAAVAGMAACSAFADDWLNLATISMTDPVTPKLSNRHVCYTDGRDIRCDSPSLYVTTGGLVGINTTNPTTQLEVNGTVSATSFVGDGSGLTNLSVSGDRIVSGTLAAIANSGGYVSLTTGGMTWGYFGSAASYLPNMGIGSAPVDTILTVSGTDLASFTGTTALQPLTLKGGGTLGNWRGIDFRTYGSWPIGRIGLQFATGGSYMAFGTSNNYANGVTNQALTIDPQGRVGVGNPVPTATLQVSGSFVVSETGQVTSATLYAGSGKVGVGTVTPATALDVSGALGSIWVRQGSGGPLATAAGNGLKIESNPNGGAIVAYDYGGGGGKNLALNSGGANVGVGNNTPKARLDVTGSISASDAIQVSGSSLTCSSGLKGAIRYSNTSSTIEYCQGTAWVSMGPSATNVPAFSAYRSSNQTVTANTWTKVQLSSENFDTQNNFDSTTNYRFQPLVAGKYIISGGVACGSTSGYCASAIYKNGTTYLQGTSYSTATAANSSVVAVIDMNGSTDYVELYVYSASTTVMGGSVNLQFSGSLIASGNSTTSGGGSATPAGSTGDIQYNSSGALAADTGIFTYASGLLKAPIISATTQVQAPSVSLTTAGTTWGYLQSGGSYLPTLSASLVSSSNISSTYVQIQSATTVLACNSGLAGAMRYTSGTMQVCDGSNWGNIGIGIPTGTIAAFATASCPNGWSEYTSGRGRFLRGIDNGAGNDPDGTRSPGATQADEFKAHTHTVGLTSENVTGSNYTANTGSWWRNAYTQTTSSAGGSETRPKNVAVTFCRYDGYQSQLQTGVATLASLSDVSVAGASNGKVLTYSNGTWVASTTSAGTAVPASSTGAIQFNVNNQLAGDTSNLFWDDANNRLGIGTNTPTEGLTVMVSGSALNPLSVANGNPTAYSQVVYNANNRVYSAGVGNSGAGLGLANKFFIYDSTSGTVRLAIDTNGKVGIGTVTPSAALEISQAVAGIRLSAAGGAFDINADNSASNGLRIFEGNNVRFQLVGGKTGISKTTPLATLDVGGTISSSDAVQIGASSLTCGSGLKGAIRYSNTSNTLEYCNSQSWASLGPSPTALPYLRLTYSGSLARYNVVPFSVAESGGGASWSSNKFTAAVPGVYLVTIGGDALGASNHSVAIRKNGSNFVVPWSANSSTTKSGTASAAISTFLNAGDYIDFYYDHDDGTKTLTSAFASFAYISTGSSSSGGSATPAGSTGDIQFNSGGALTADTGQLYWDATNNRIGIGTSTPSAPLQVAGTSGVAQVQLGTASNGMQINVFDGVTTYLQGTGAPGQNLGFGTQNFGNLYFMTSNTTKMALDTSGNLGIGVTTPRNKLDVLTSSEPYTDAGAGYGGFRIVTGTGSATDEALIFGVHDTDYSWIQPVKPGAAYRNLALNPNGGNVGIGTVYPSGTLHVVGAPVYFQANAGASTSGYSALSMLNKAGKEMFKIQSEWGTDDSGIFFMTDGNDNGATSNRRMVLQRSTGNLGIGVWSPGSAIDVYRSGLAGMALMGGGDGSNFSGISLKSDEATDKQWWIYHSQGTLNSFGLAYYNGSGWTNPFSILPGGNVGVGTLAPAARLDVVSSTAGVAVARFQNGTGACTFTPAASGSGTWSCSSDARLKKDVADSVGSALDWLSDMRIRDYTMRADNSRQTGVVAQELLLTHPEMVHMGMDGFYTVDEPGIWKLVKAIQELKADNDNMVSRTKAVEAGAEAVWSGQFGLIEELKKVKTENAELRGLMQGANDNIAAMRKELDSLKRAVSAR